MQLLVIWDYKQEKYHAQQIENEKKFSANKYENVNNSWHSHIFSGEIFMLSYV